jgi:BirA family biotin operon repressor/biotin-[acetyl-CoA-carboxylase] ligase
VTALGRPRLHLAVTGSTNDRARELAAAGAPHGTLVTAAEQTAGRGRQGRRWSAPPGQALLMSLVVRDPPPLLPLMAGVAVCAVAGERALVKWPNDVVVEDGGGSLAKLAGILAEGRPQAGWAVVGIGLNVAVQLEELAPELRSSAAARAGGGSGLAAATMGLGADQLEPTLARVLAALERALAASQAETLAAWGERDALRGRELSWTGGRGVGGGIDGEGRLVVIRADGGRTALDAGEVRLDQDQR